MTSTFYLLLLFFFFMDEGKVFARRSSAKCPNVARQPIAQIKSNVTHDNPTTTSSNLPNKRYVRKTRHVHLMAHWTRSHRTRNYAAKTRGRRPRGASCPTPVSRPIEPAVGFGEKVQFSDGPDARPTWRKRTEWARPRRFITFSSFCSCCAVHAPDIRIADGSFWLANFFFLFTPFIGR